MTTDLSKMTVEELIDWATGDLAGLRLLDACHELAHRLSIFETALKSADGALRIEHELTQELAAEKRELAHRLEGAQQQIVAQAVVLRDYITLASSPTDNWPQLALCVLESARVVFKDHESILSAHDAKVAAEVLEEAERLCDEEADSFQKSEGMKFPENKTDAEAGLRGFSFVLEQKAAEYRAKAGRKE